jgi:NADPH:quinone reductase-like Zn-dependent oxidoreductase
VGWFEIQCARYVVPVSLFEQVEASPAAIEFVTEGLETGTLKPVIDRIFTFDEMADVHRSLEQSDQFGKSW